ncbi:MAG: pilus assembly protein [Alphaproteobacteria bacterium]|nr:pilus assembly protein [Alphaproteobacteria bacterium]MBU0865865.1 pilus assembly protein [Alphaproteobacteria bacterium]MBU1824286.1 pilus assembly protein [Alphaproteobacteria bacterium]
MRGTVFSRLRLGTKRLLRDKRGNAMFLTAAAALPVIGLVGSGVDIGRAYMAQLRLQQACDAGVLAGRRAMGGSTYSTAAQAEADKMFEYNYSENAYGSSDVTFTSVAQGSSSVSGTATATLPTALMQIFDFDEFDLTVSCAAKLEISNADVMMVLDVTGSMATTNSGDSVNRITALKDATMDFFDTLTGAEMGDGRLRFGVVPYSSSANVGQILYAKNPAWLADTITNYPSRTPIYRTEWGTGTTTTGDPSNGNASPSGNWSGYSNQSSSITQANCVIPTQPAGSPPGKSGGTSSSQTGQYIDGNGNRVTNSNVFQTYSYKAYEYRWRNSRCQRRERTYLYTETTPSTLTQPPVQVFDDKYRYESRTFDVSGAKSGSGIVTNTGDSGADRTSYWGGCVMERKTVTFAANEAAPSTALDMDVDTAPTSDDDTKWKLLIPEIAFPRASGPGGTPSDQTVEGGITKNSGDVSGEGGTNGSWQNYSRYWSNGWGVCPAAAMKLTTQTASDRSSFNTYIDSLQPVGGTYHDAGMVWGVRLLSPDGMFADENATAPNNRPISRHIVFMTDGDMSANMGNLTFQGYEWIDKRVGGTSDATLTTRHNNRFAQLCEKAKGKNITVWVVSFGVALNSSLTNCATPGKAYQANNAAQLNQNFQAIARQISKLRLSQ